MRSRDGFLIAASVLGAAAVSLDVAAFWPTLVGEAGNACEGMPFDRTLWPPSGNCGDAPWRQFQWEWVETVIVVLAGGAATLAVIAAARRSRK